MTLRIPSYYMNHLPSPPRATAAPGTARYTEAQERLEALAELRRIWSEIDSPFTRAMIGALRVHRDYWSRDITEMTTEDIHNELKEELL